MTRTTSRMYIITRKDLRPGQQLAQSAHVAALFNDEYLKHKSWDGSIVVLSVDDAEALKDAGDYIRGALSVPIKNFQEPDLDNSLTAIGGMVPWEQQGGMWEFDLALRRTHTLKGWLEGKFQHRYV